MFQLVDPLPMNAMTLLGSTTGPAVATGIPAPFDSFVFLGKQETWEAARLFGFVEPGVHEKTADALAEALVRVAELEDRLLLMKEIQERLTAFASAETP